MNNVTRGPEPKRGFVVHEGPKSLSDTGFTMLHPFYNERERFELLVDNWETWSDRVKSKIQVVLVDDCSPSPVHTWFTPEVIDKLGTLNLSVYRITSDLKWNTPGALNLGFTVAPHPWVLTMDSDCTFSAEDIEKFLSAEPLEEAYYRFKRQRFGDPEVENLDNFRPLPCSLLLHKNLFWHVGGFDEDFTGERTGGYALFDTYFHHRCLDLGYEWYTWHDVEAIEWMPSVASMGRPKEVRDHYRINKKLMYQKQDGSKPIRSELLRFDWERTFSYSNGKVV